MQPTSSVTPNRELQRRFGRSGRLRHASVLAVVLCGACGPSDGVVGVLSSTPSGAAPTFEAEFPTRDSRWQSEAGIPGGGVTIGDANDAAGDGRVATLVFPGNPENGSNDDAGPDLATALSSTDRFGYGTYRTRVAFGACARGEETTQAVLGYFSDGADHNGNGIRDETEIDFQVLCGSPSLAYLTVFTDYEERNTGAVFRKLSHVVDFATGRTYDTPSASEDAFVTGATDPSLVLDLFSAGRFYELGFEWHPGKIRFFIDAGSGEKTLWTLSDPARVPTGTVQVVYNAWHPETHWYPLASSADYPAQDVSMWIDWFRFYAD